MKKTSTLLLALCLSVSLFGIANAGFNNGMGGGCGNCQQSGGSSVSDPFRKFQADTIDLRQEMMTKRFELQRENLKVAPDTAKIAALQAEITSLQTKIQDFRAQSGLPVGMRDGECGQIPGGCGKKTMGRTGGCNGPCGAQK
ncbi:MAG: hypothetical protein PHY09_08565 [Desulfuromonadaceae bacterium]|nr:hypothetical protein [Desulfuromonadaceae bacterium]MDD5106820.1 hypothetical protein [Desulfuromonadaceae bacterium]